MEDKIKVSVIVPVYNVEKYLDRCLESIINQTLKEIEIILVDDGSLDNSGKMCDGYLNKDSRIKVIHKPNQGLGFARNSGMEIAEGEYIAFVDSDDYIELNMLEEMYNKIKSENADTCLCNIFNLEGTCREVIKEILIRSLGPKSNGQDYIGMSVWRGLFSREIIEKNKIRFFSEREFISEDIMFDFEYYNYSKCVTIINKKFYNYMVNEGSLTHKYKSNRFEMCKKLYEKEKELLFKNNIYELGIERLNMTYFYNINTCLIQEMLFRKQNGTQICNRNIKQIMNNVEFLEEINIINMKFKDKVLVYALKSKLIIFVKMAIILKIILKNQKKK